VICGLVEVGGSSALEVVVEVGDVVVVATDLGGQYLKAILMARQNRKR
jgi:hypothetical protein